MLATIAAQVVEWFLMALAKLGLKEIKQIESDMEAKQTAQSDEKKLTDAKTPEEIASAANSINRNTFN